MIMWTVQIRDQTSRSVQSDLDLHCVQKLPALLQVEKEIKINKIPLELKTESIKS